MRRSSLFIILPILLILSLFGVWWFNKPVSSFPVGQPCGRLSEYPQRTIEGLDVVLGYRIAYRCEEPMIPTGIVLHYTATDSFFRTLDVLEKRGLYVHLVVDVDGTSYQIMDSLEERAAGAPGSNGWAIHIEIVGDRDTLFADAMNNGPQFQGVLAIIKRLSSLYDIPLHSDIPQDGSLEWHGIYSHEQIAELHPEGLDNGKVDPGVEYMEMIMATLRDQPLDRKKFLPKEEVE